MPLYLASLNHDHVDDNGVTADDDISAELAIGGSMGLWQNPNGLNSESRV